MDNWIIILFLLIFGFFWRIKEIGKCHFKKKEAENIYKEKITKEEEELKNLFEIQANDNFMESRFKKL